MNVYAKSNAENGEIVKIQFLRRDELGQTDSAPPDGTFDPTNTVPVDFSTNVSTEASLLSVQDEFRVESGVLLRNDVEVPITPDGPELEYFRKAQLFVIDVTDNMGTATLPDTKEMVALLLMIVLNKRDF